MKKYSLLILALLYMVLAVKPEILHSSGETCGDVDVRHDISRLRELEGCQIVEGSVKILMAQDYSAKDFANLSFPHLTEITDFLIVSRVSGIKSISQLFPNLVRIGGRALFNNYSLVLYENSDLESIGLTHLKNITRGAVRIEQNDMLCYVDTVDWDKIVSKEFHGRNIFRQNMFHEVCPKCDKGVETCWTHNSPQIACKCNGGSCTANGTCCDSACLSCRDDDVKVCTVCNKYIVGNAPHERCVADCPYRTYEFMGYRCISEPECRNLNVKTNVESPFIPFQGLCQEGCPKDFKIKYAVDGNKMSAQCSPCIGKECWKSCKAGIVHDIETARKLKGCQVIEGPLEIQLRSSISKKVIKELEESLSDIIEIEDYLKVARSFSILSLSFLKNLKTIRGKNLESGKYSVVIWDNQNLERLFTGKQEVDIKAGKHFFYFNPKLCFYHIETLAGGAEKIENYETAAKANGDKTSCNITRLKTNATDISSTAASIKFESLKLEDQRKLLKYVIFYIEAPQKNLDLWQGRSANDEDEWNGEDFSPMSANGVEEIYKLSKLKPFTQYAYYVKAYTLVTEKTGAQSDLRYFKTLPSKPDKVENLEIVTKNSSSVHLSWKPPKNSNGELKEYEISFKKLEIMKNFIKDRDFCHQPINQDELKREIQKAVREMTKDIQSKGSNDTSDAHDFTHEMNQMLNAKSRVTRSITTKRQVSIDHLHDDVIQTVNANTTEVFIKSLDHFSSYAISIRACRKRTSAQEAIEDVCSFDSQIIVQTLEDPKADLIDHFDVVEVPTNHTGNDIKISWVPPANPNGHVLNYIVKERRVDENAKPDLICISLRNRGDVRSQVITHVNPGNYSISIATFTLAGIGNYSSPKYIYVKSVSHFGLIASPSFLTLLLLVAASAITVSAYTIYKKNQPNHESLQRLENFDSTDRILE